MFTVVTLGCGFKGGEVMPLFFIGAGLGSAIGHALGAPVDLFAAIGLVAVFAGASNTPLASTIIGIELDCPACASNGEHLGELAGLVGAEPCKLDRRDADESGEGDAEGACGAVAHGGRHLLYAPLPALQHVLGEGHPPG